MLKRLFGWGQKPQQEDPPPAPTPAEADLGPELDFHGLLDEIEKGKKGTSKTFKVAAIPGHSSQVDELNRTIGPGGSYHFDWKTNSVTVVLPPQR